MKLLEIKLFPLIRKKVVFDTTKEDFIFILEELRKESYMLFPRFSDGGKHKQYSANYYSNFFIFESLYKFTRDFDAFPSFQTRIYGRHKVRDMNQEVNFYVTFDVLGLLLFAGAIFSFFFFLREIINSDNFIFSDWAMMIVPYVIVMYMFNDESYGDKKFIERLISALAKRESERKGD